MSSQQAASQSSNVEQSPSKKRRTSKTTSTPTKTPTSKSKRKEPEPSAAPSTPSAAKLRSNRARTEEMHIVNTCLIDDEESDIHWHGAEKFTLKAATGNIYEVTIDKLNHCTCIDFKKGYICKHIMFVLYKVFQVKYESYYILQKTFSEEELIQLYSQRERDLHNVMADEETQITYEMSQPVAPLEVSSEELQRIRRPLSHAGEPEYCPLCIEAFDPQAPADSITFCHSCGYNVHQKCWDHVLTDKSVFQICPNCAHVNLGHPRNGSTLPANVIINEGFLNIARPGERRERDYSNKKKSTSKRSSQQSSSQDSPVEPSSPGPSIFACIRAQLNGIQEPSSQTTESQTLKKKSSPKKKTTTTKKKTSTKKNGSASTSTSNSLPTEPISPAGVTDDTLSLDWICTCCAHINGPKKKQYNYYSFQKAYKTLFPGSPVNGTQVCDSCYRKCRIYRKELEEKAKSSASVVPAASNSTLVETKPQIQHISSDSIAPTMMGLRPRAMKLDIPFVDLTD
jgi:hypothetical protein